MTSKNRPEHHRELPTFPLAHVLDAEAWIEFNLVSGGLNEVVL